MTYLSCRLACAPSLSHSIYALYAVDIRSCCSLLAFKHCTVTSLRKSSSQRSARASLACMFDAARAAIPTPIDFSAVVTALICYKPFTMCMIEIDHTSVQTNISCCKCNIAQTQLRCSSSIVPVRSLLINGSIDDHEACVSCYERALGIFLFFSLVCACSPWLQIS
jgi:hypothetical protein